MKKLYKISSYILATVMVLLISQTSVFAADDSVNKGSSLSGMQVFGGLAVLLLVIFLPLVKKSKKHETI
jgi:hypothetical protein